MAKACEGSPGKAGRKSDPGLADAKLTGISVFQALEFRRQVLPFKDSTWHQTVCLVPGGLLAYLWP
jgi:hypothetical protein